MNSASIRQIWAAPGPRLLISLILLLGLTFFVYANSFHGEFVFDDLGAIRQDGFLNRIETLTDVWEVRAQGRWLAMATFGLNFLWGGWEPYGFHVVNTLIHALNAALIFLIALHLSAKRWFPAFAAAAVFAVHPIFTEGVASIAGRFSSLCALFYFAAVLTFLKGLDAGSLKIRLAWFTSTAMATYLAYLTKQEALALPIALAALYWLRQKKLNWRVTIPVLLVPVALLVFFRQLFAGLVSGVAANRALVVAGMDAALEPLVYARTYTTAIVSYYFPRFLWPADLSANPYVPIVEAWYRPEFLFAAIVLVGGGWLVVRYRTKHPFAATGLVLVLVSPLTAYVAMPLADIVLEHRAYTAGAGIALLWGWGIDRIGRKRPAVEGVLLLLILTVFSAMTVQRNRIWRTSLDLWEATERASPENVRPHLNLAAQYDRIGRVDDALSEYAHALELGPGAPVAMSNMAALYTRRERLDLAEPILLELTESNPDFILGFHNLGELYVAKGDVERAIEAFRQALDIDPAFAPTHLSMGDALTVKGDYAGAAESYALTIRYRPDAADQVKLNLGISYFKAGANDRARLEFLKLMESPVAAAAWQNLGVLEASLGNLDGALEALRRSAEIQPNSEIYNAQGRIYLEKGMPDLAMEPLRLALERRPDLGEAHINLALAYQNKGQVEEAKRILAEFIRAYPGSVWRVQARARLDALD